MSRVANVCGASSSFINARGAPPRLALARRLPAYALRASARSRRSLGEGGRASLGPQALTHLVAFGLRGATGRCYGEQVSERIAFGLFEFDPETGTLSREGIPVRLQPQPARVLGILVGHAGDVVSREDLRQQVWAEGTFVDFERGLNFCVAQIRSALGDSATSPRFLETLPRRGYRFIAPVRRGSETGDRGSGAGGRGSGIAEPGHLVGDSGQGIPAASDPQSPVPGPRSPVPDALSATHETRFSGRRLWVVAALVGLTVAVSILAVTASRSGQTDRRIRVAVVPFDNETGLDDFDAIARGVADATVARLASPERVRTVNVIGNAAALYQPRAFRDLKRIGTSLNAEYIVLAQMKRDSTGVRLIAHLIRVSDEGHVWANTYDRPAFTLDVQAEIAESIADHVVSVLRKVERSLT
jgi:DNA-binding winged helix-turn-helix (wHTH) protein/TolB-like protein